MTGVQTCALPISRRHTIQTQHPETSKQLPLWLSCAFAAPILVAVILGIVSRWSILMWIMMLITAVMLGLLLFTVVLTKRADKVGYAKLEGRPGAAACVGVCASEGCALARHWF